MRCHLIQSLAYQVQGGHMNFEDAIKSHNLWREAFLHYVNNSEGNLNLNMLAKHLNAHSSLFKKTFSMFGISNKPLDADFIGNSHNCNFGQWIDSVEGVFKKNNDFIRLIKLHNKFHLMSAKIVNHIENNDRKSVLKLANKNSEFHKISNDIEIYILRIKRLIDSK